MFREPMSKNKSTLTIKIIRAIRLSTVSLINLITKLVLVALFIDYLDFNAEVAYFLILFYLFFQSYVLHMAYTVKENKSLGTFISFINIYILLFILDYFIVILLGEYTALYSYIALIASSITHTLRYFLFAKFMFKE
tara:strand:+ start:10 stop:420 length:411 start_codon:yes stop_codon:yes gene_type:complete